MTSASRLMRRLLERYGFTVERAETCNFNPIMLWRDLRRGGSSMEQHTADRALTDRLKGRATVSSRAARGAFRVATWMRGAAGLGDGLYVVALRTEEHR